MKLGLNKGLKQGPRAVDAHWLDKEKWRPRLESILIYN